MQQGNLYCIYITLSCITANSAVYILKYDNNNKKVWLTIYLLKNQCVVFSGILRLGCRLQLTEYLNLTKHVREPMVVVTFTQVVQSRLSVWL